MTGCGVTFGTMKIRLVALLAILATGFAIAASPASAQRPIPGIKQTVAFKQLKSYTQFLFSKRNVATPSARKQIYKRNLTTRRKNANVKVNALYSQKLNRLSKQDDNQERRQVKQIRTNQKRQVQAIQQDLAMRIADLQSDQSAAVQRVFNRYAPQINPRADKRDRLKRQLSRTTNPTKRAALIRQINKLQTQINALVSDRTTDVNNVNSRYQARITSVTNLYNSRIANARANAKRQIQQAKNAWRQTFRTQVQAAKSRRNAQKELVDTVASRGFGYIQQMPPVNE